RRPSTISGVVLSPDGKPVAGARVSLGELSPMDELAFGDEDEDTKGEARVRTVMLRADGDGPAPTGPPLGVTFASRVRTDEQGRFTIEQVAPGSHVVRATKRGFRAARISGVAVEEGVPRERLELRLGRGLELVVAVPSAA